MGSNVVINGSVYLSTCTIWAGLRCYTTDNFENIKPVLIPSPILQTLDLHRTSQMMSQPWWTIRGPDARQ
jgi:hypothetical protein